MNTIDQATTAAPVEVSQVSIRAARQPTKLLRRLALGTAGMIVSLALVRGVAPGAMHPLVAALQHSGLVPVGLGALLLALSGLIATWLMAWARCPGTPTALPRRRWRLGLRGDPDLPGRMARWPQALVMTALGAAGLACWRLPLSGTGVPRDEIILGVAAVALSFPVLLAERVMAATPVSQLPEAPQLRALLLLAVVAVPAAGLLQIIAGAGVPFAARLNFLILLPVTMVAVELCVRSLGRCFLPPPAPAVARAAIDSVLARLIAEGVRTGSLSAPVRQHFGIDFSRSWALAYLRAATPTVVLLLVLLCWGLSGVVLISLDQRGVYERFGAPVAVLHPGLHVILPWPMGQVRRLDFGVIHDSALTETAAASPVRAADAEGLPPPEADRLWDQVHAAEVTLLIASRTNGQPSFQAVSADIKLRYRVGLSDQDALNAAYRVTQPDVLLRAAARQVIAAFFAARTLEQALGENREAMADRLRAAIQDKLDAAGCGIELAMLVIEAIHPPAGAADAYQAVQAAQIMSRTSILRERGKALSSRSNASQQATAVVSQAQAAAAEVKGTAAADLTRFNADHAAVTTGGPAFLLERRLASIANGLAQSSLTIIDHRIPVSDAPMVDLRPMSPLTARSAGHEKE